MLFLCSQLCLNQFSAHVLCSQTHAADAKPEEKPFQMMEKYVDAVGHARKMPWPGYWHSRNRYASQDELLTAARGFHNRSVPVDVIVIDWFHWKIMGDWSFNPAAVRARGGHAP